MFNQEYYVIERSNGSNYPLLGWDQKMVCFAKANPLW